MAGKHLSGWETSKNPGKVMAGPAVKILGTFGILIIFTVLSPYFIGDYTSIISPIHKTFGAGRGLLKGFKNYC